MENDLGAKWPAEQFAAYDTLSDETIRRMIAAAEYYFEKICELAVDLCPDAGTADEISCGAEMDADGFTILVGSERASGYLCDAYELLRDTFPPEIVSDLDPVFSRPMIRKIGMVSPVIR